MLTVKCRECGRFFETENWEKVVCDECVKNLRSTTLADRVCRMCGRTFEGGPRAWYCPECRHKRQLEQKAKYRANGAARKLGEEYFCERCGKPYILQSGRQRYCPICSEIAVREKDREASIKWNNENKDKRKDRTKIRKCVICGTEYVATGSRNTCSEKCRKEQRRRTQQKADQNRRMRARERKELEKRRSEN